MSDSINKIYKIMIDEVKLKDISKVLNHLDESDINESSNGGVCGAGCDGGDGKVCGLGCDGKAIDMIDPKGKSNINKEDLQAVKEQIPQLRRKLLKNIGSVMLEHQPDLYHIDISRDLIFPRRFDDIDGSDNIDL